MKLDTLYSLGSMCFDAACHGICVQSRNGKPQFKLFMIAHFETIRVETAVYQISLKNWQNVNIAAVPLSSSADMPSSKQTSLKGRSHLGVECWRANRDEGKVASREVGWKNDTQYRVPSFSWPVFQVPEVLFHSFSHKDLKKGLY